MKQRWVEWPTLGVLVLCYSVFGALTYFHSVLPWWLLYPPLIYCVALHGSLQHEVTHGHPTRLAWLNEALVFPSLWVAYPFRRYKQTHLKHHHDERLTDPLDDPESYYLPEAQWQAKPKINQRILTLNNTFLGRMLIGPAVGLYAFYQWEARAVLRGSRHHIIAWALHGVSLALLMVWLVGVCGWVWWHYVLFVAYPGVSLSLVRSFLEHRAAEDPNHRTVIVDASPFWSFLFLNNNLHIVHHKYPAKPWYHLRRLYRQRRDEFRQLNGGYCLDGYKELVFKYALKPKEPVAHPLMRRGPVYPYNEGAEPQTSRGDKV